MLYLPLTFSAALQYYAKRTQTTVKDYFPTERYPTRRAVVGMIGAALGCPRGDARLKELDESLIIKCRRTRGSSSIYSDFQRISAPKGERMVQISGKPADAGKTLTKTVEYIQDTEFAVYIGAEDEKLLKEIYDALCAPWFIYYFGKRCCMPNKPVVTTFELKTKEELPDVLDCA